MRKSTLLVAASALIAVFYIYFIAPVVAAKRTDTMTALQEGITELKKYEMLMSSEQTAEKEAEKAKKELNELEKGLLKATDISTASARLQSKLQDMAEADGLKVLSIRAGTHAVNKGYLRFPIEMEGSGTISALSNFLKTLDSKEQYIRIDRLDVNVAAEESLRIKIQFTGLAKI